MNTPSLQGPELAQYATDLQRKLALYRAALCEIKSRSDREIIQMITGMRSALEAIKGFDISVAQERIETTLKQVGAL